MNRSAISSPGRKRRFETARLVRRVRALRSARPVDSSAAEADRFERELVAAALEHEEQPVMRMFFDRLSEEDVGEVIRRAASDPLLRGLPPIGDEPLHRRWLTLNYGVWLKMPSVLQKTGLPPDQPPEEVHSMARGPLSAAGGLGEADMMVGALHRAGVDLGDAGSALDFGCSSGRVVRVLAAAFPHVRWLGCDPNERTIAWASEHLGQIDFFVSPQDPPLQIADGELGLVYAISIWSHFAPELGLRWFDDMHRVIRPGGHLLMTTHGMQSVAAYASEGLRPAEQCREIREALYRGGCWYTPEFGESGDAGVMNPQWGTAFLSAEWMLANLCPHWRVLEFGPGRNQGNQDLYVLQRA